MEKYFLTFGLIIYSIISAAQIPKKYQNSDKFTDSLALHQLREFYPDRSIGISELTVKNKKTKVKNYNSYTSFSLPIRSDVLTFTDTLKVVNFGTTSEHDRCFMLVILLKNNEVQSFVLGKNDLQKDINFLQQFFSPLNDKIIENHQLEIWDLFIKCRLGVVFTPLYLH